MSVPMPSPEPTSAESARPRPVRYRRSWLERIVVAVGVVASVLAFMAAGVLAWGLDKYQSIDRIAIVFGGGDTEDGEAASLPEPGEPRNWLLVGSDSREGIEADDPNAHLFLGDEGIAGKRTDTMIIARVDPEAKTVELLSIPRDLYVPIAGTDRESRVNSAFNGEGGEQRLVDTIQDYFGFEIHHYAEINFVGFQDIVDAMGGVPIWFDQPLRDAGSGLNVTSAGCHVLDGFQALAFARGRNVEFFQNGTWQLDGTGDLGRTSRQQYFISRVAATAASKLDIASLGTVNRILDVGGDNLALDQSVTADDLLELAGIFASVEDGQIQGHALPVFQFRAPNNAAVLGMHVDEAQPVLNIFRGVVPEVDENGVPVVTTIPPSYVVYVYNGSRVAGQAKEVAADLGTAGFETGPVDNAVTGERTRIVYGPGLEFGATQVARHVGVAVDFELDESIDHVAIVTGTDFTGILADPRDEASVNGPTPAAPPTTEAVAEVVEVEVVGVVPGPSPEGTACS